MHTSARSSRIKPRLVGRDDELASLASWWLARQRGDDSADAAPVLTIVGPPGVGKTTLAVRFADESVRIDSHVCQLTSSDDADSIRATVIRALELSRRDLVSDSEVDQLVADTLAARASTSLLMFDNAEHVTGPLRDLLSRWLPEEGPGPCVLVTSREALDIACERVVRLEPLSLPEQASPTSIARSQAGTLFLHLATHHHGAADLDDAEAATAITRVLRAVDGLPLAIELAAARLEVLSIGELADRIDTPFQVLRAPLWPPSASRHDIARLQTLWHNIDVSWQLLDAHQRSVLAALSIFESTFGLPAAAAVTDDRTGEAASTRRTLEQLTACSLVQHIDTGDEPAGRWRLLASIRTFARGHLDDDLAHLARVEEAALRFYLEHASRRVDAARSAHRYDDAIGWLDLERDNLRALYERLSARAPSCARSAERAQQLASTLAYINYERQNWQRVTLLLEDSRRHASRHPTRDPWSLLRVLGLASRLAQRHNQRDEARRLGIERLVYAIRARDTDSHVSACLSLCREARFRGDLRAARACHRSATTRLGELDNHKLRAYLAFADAELLLFESTDPRPAIDALLRCLTHIERADVSMPPTEANTHMRLGGAFSELLELDRAVYHYERARARYAESGAIKAISWVSSGLGVVELQRGNVLHAREHFCHAIEVHRSLDDHANAASVAGLLANLELRQGFARDALDRLRDAEPSVRGYASDHANQHVLRAMAHGLLADPRQAARWLDHGRAALERLSDGAFDAPVALLHIAEQTCALMASVATHGPLAPHDEARAAVAAYRHAEREDVRLIASILDARLDELDTLEQRWWFDVDGRWVQPPEQPRIELETRQVLATLLRQLVRARLQRPGQTVARPELIEALWSDVAPDTAVAANRLYVSLSHLRRLGLDEILEHSDDGYRLSPDVSCALGWQRADGRTARPDDLATRSLAPR